MPLFDSYRKKRYSFLGKSASSTNILQENIQQLELTKRKNEKLLINVLKKIKLKEDTLEEEREKFSMMKGIYLEQIKKLTKSLFGNKVKNYQLPISGTEKKLHKKAEV